MDCSFKTDEGRFNFRVGAIIQNGTKVLMACNPSGDRCFYSVGGRVKMNETLEEAVLREVKEETGINSEIDRMGFIHENFFTNRQGEAYHEISVFFYIKITDKLLSVKDGRLTDEGPNGEFLKWIDLSRERDFKIFPEFFETELKNPSDKVKHMITKDN